MIYKISRLPPSVNSMYGINRKAGVKNRYRTSEYDLWIYEAGRELLPVVPLKCSSYRLQVLVPPKMKHANADLDNFLKPISDLLVKNGATPDDRYCLDFRILCADMPMIEIQVEGV